MGINRLSIGVQSFFEEDLLFMNRSHNAGQSLNAVTIAKELGFENTTIDLIYGSNTTTNEMWEKNIAIALELKIPHISSYCLTIEEKTVFHDWTKKGKIAKPNEEKANFQFEYLIDSLTQNGYDHYEISNFGKPTFHALHNTNYWRGHHYLGVGPSAHSYDGNRRTWTAANNIQYMNSLNENNILNEEEVLSQEDKYNEYVMTGLRTMWGIDMDKIQSEFGEDYLSHFKNEMTEVWLTDKIEITNNNIKLTKLGKSFADGVASHFFK